MSFVATHRDRFGVEPILRVLEVPASTFYGWVAQQRDPCRRRRQDALLLGEIRAVHQRSGGTYGAPRVHAQLRRDGTRTSRKRVERLMRTHGLQGAFLRKRWRGSTRQNPNATPAPDLVNRDFTAAAPNRLWVADISRIPTGEGPLWLASIRDAFSRRIVGWKASDRADTDLVLGALYELERIAHDSPQDRRRIAEVLCAYARTADRPEPPVRLTNFGGPPDGDTAAARTQANKPRSLTVRAPDVQAAVTILGAGRGRWAARHRSWTSTTPSFRSWACPVRSCRARTCPVRSCRARTSPVRSCRARLSGACVCRAR
jgi:hypothetical protein